MRKTKTETMETVRKLIAIARNHFTQYGYAKASLQSIVEEAELTRGAVYHHFRNKKELFRVVLEDVQREVAEKVEREALSSEDPWQQLYLGCLAFIMAAIEDRNRRIMLIDGPAILGWDVWREMDKKHSMRLLKEQLVMMQEQGYILQISTDALTYFLSGGLNEITLWLANESENLNHYHKAKEVLVAFLKGFGFPTNSD